MSTMPAFTILGALWLSGKLGGDNPIVKCAEVCGMFTFACAGVFEIVGALLFIIAGACLKDGNSKAITYSIVAGVFGLIAAMSCCCTIVCCGIAAKEEKEEKEKDKEDADASAGIPLIHTVQ